MIKIYHNPRCSKSREGLAILEESGKDFKILKYLENRLTLAEITEIIELLDIEPIDLVRQNEAFWKENYKDKRISKAHIIKLMLSNPKLMERPIVINGDKAVIGRPAEKILTII
ncbi:Arsenate reductase [Kordia antarctica]|uniref:Arsenate reductase n=1 Tax=Kordia antarctica TaxID=1218801 RepID=A0A7L4ZGS7_9FLAO|nr:arsenate reductase (glutaredoxin) [Kordia antarctica]QHI35923.1 Arsenate reductase [Kordia antarctica]